MWLCEKSDGVTAASGDCDDAIASVYPGALELCDYLDNDCDGTIDPEGICDWTWASELVAATWYGTTERGSLGYSTGIHGDWDLSGTVDLTLGNLATTEGRAEAWITDGPGAGDTLLREGTTLAQLVLAMDGSDASALAGCDLDGDGFLDLAMGSSSYASLGHGDITDGLVNIVYKPRGRYLLPAEADATIYGVYDHVGIALGCGDPSGDGVMDLIVGASTDGLYGEGAVAVLPMPLHGVSFVDDVAEAKLEGNWPLAHAGDALAVADFTGDGVDDIAVGADYLDVDGYNAVGGVYVVHGPIGADVHLPEADALLLGEGGTTTYVGSELAVMSDQNGDGLSDLLIGGRSSGYAYVMNGPGPAGPTYVSHLDATVALGETTGVAEHVASGDFDGDGLSDLSASNNARLVDKEIMDGLIVVVPGPLEGLVFADAAGHFVVSPHPWALGRALATGDANLDGRDDLWVGATGVSIGEIEGGGGSLFLGADLLPPP